MNNLRASFFLCFVLLFGNIKESDVLKFNTAEILYIQNTEAIRRTSLLI